MKQGPRPFTRFQARIHPELKKALKREAVDCDRTIEGALHKILCLVFDRSDLLDPDEPDSPPVNSRATGKA